MDKYAPLASLFDTSQGTGNRLLDEALGVRPITQEEREERARRREEALQNLGYEDDEGSPKLSSPNMASPKSGKGHENLTFARRYLEEAGVPAHVAAGLVGNIMAESGGRTGAVGDQGASVGAFQWQGPRLHGGNGYTGLIPFAQQRGGSPYDLKTQLDYALYELQGPEAAAYKHALATKSPEEAAAAIAQYYERPAGHDYSKRQAYARQYANSAGAPEGTYLDVSQNQNSPAANIARQEQPEQPAQSGLETYPVQLTNGQTINAEKGMSLVEVADMLKQNNIEGVPVRSFQTPNGQYVNVEHDMSDDDVMHMLRKEAPEFTVPPGQAVPDYSSYGAAAKQGVLKSVGQLGVGAGELAKAVGFDEFGKKATEWGKEKEKAGEEAFIMPGEDQAGAFKRKFGIPLVQGVAGMAPILPAMAVPGVGGTVAAAGLLGTQAVGSLEERAREEGKDFNLKEAAPYAAGEMAVNLMPWKAMSPLFRAASQDAVIGSREAIKALVEKNGIDGAKDAIGGYVGNALKQAGMVEAAGATADITSSVLERAYTGKSLWDKNAWDEYKDVAAQGAPFYAVTGGGAGLAHRHMKATEIQRVQEQQDLETNLTAQKERDAQQSQAAEALAAAEEQKKAERQPIEIPEDLRQMGVPYEEALSIMKAEGRMPEMPEQEKTEAVEPTEPKVPLVQEAPAEKPYYESLGIAKNQKLLRNALSGLDPTNPEHVDTIETALSHIEENDIPHKPAAMRTLRTQLEETRNAQQIPETGEIYGDGGTRPQALEGIESAPIGGEGVRESRPEIRTAEESYVKAPQAEVEEVKPIKVEQAEQVAAAKAPVTERPQEAPGVAPKIENLAASVKDPTFAQKLGELYRDTAKHGRETSLESEWFDQFAPLSKALRKLPTLVDGRSRADFQASHHTQVGNVIADSTHNGYTVLDDDGTLSTIKDEKLSPVNIFKRAEKSVDGGDFREMLVALRGRTIRKQDAEIRQRADGMATKADQLEAHAATLGNTPAAAKFIKHADNLRNLAEKQLASINYDTGRTGVSQEQIAKAEELQRTNPVAAQEAENLRELLRHSVRMWEKSGLLTKEQAKEYNDYPDYFPLYKTEQFEEQMIDPIKYVDEVISHMGRGSKNLPEIKRQKAHFHEVLTEGNVLRHLAFMTLAASRNELHKNAAKQLELVGGAEPSKLGHKDEHAVQFRDNGTPVYYTIKDKQAWYAMQAAQPLLNPIFKPLKNVSNLVRGAMVMNPLFWFRQLVREPLTASLVGRTGLITPFDTIKEIGKIMADKSPRYEELKRKGIVAAQDAITDPVEFVKEIQKKRGLVANGVEYVKKIHEAVDGATRAVVAERAYKQALSEGKTEAEANSIAAIKAREIINFSKQGRNENMRTIRATTPFFGAALNGLHVMAKALSPENIGNLSKAEAMEARRFFYARASMIALYSTAYALAMSDDEEYLKSPDRAQNWLIPTGDADNPFTKIAIPFELGFFFKTLPEALALNNMGAISTKRAVSEAGKTFSDTVIPPFPTIYAIKPLAEAAMNFDFHTWAPVEPRSETDKVSYLRDRKAGELTKAVAKKLNEGGIRSDVLSPNTMEHVLKGYLGQIWAITRAASDYVLYDGPEKPDKILADAPVIGGAFARGGKDQAVNEFYDVYDSVKEFARTQSSAVSKGNAGLLETLKEDKDYVKMMKANEPLKEVMDNIDEKNAAIERVTNMQDISGSEKKNRIDLLTKQRNALANKGVGLAKRLGFDI